MSDTRLPELDPYRTIIEGDFAQRVHELSPDACSFGVAAQQIELWRMAGRHTVFNAGTYDILTPNHILSLVQCRVLGAMSLLGMQEIQTQQDQLLVHEVAASDAIALMITLDTNRALEMAKSRRADKGGAPKPTLDWSNRALMLAMQSIPGPDYATRRSAVDFITRHGPECCLVCADGSCTNEDNAAMTVKLRPDVVVVNSDSRRTVDDLRGYEATGLLPDTHIAINDENQHQYYDPVLGGPAKTSAIIGRVRS